MYTKVVTVLSNTGTGDQNITFTPNGTDPSWTPKVAILQWSNVSTSLNTFQEGVARGFGFTDGTNQRCIAMVSEDNVASSDVATSSFNNALVAGHTTTGTITTIDAQASFSQWLTNGMRINWSNAPTAAFYIQVLFLGGSDITNVIVGTLMTEVATATTSLTGLAFKPDFGMFLLRADATENAASSTTPEMSVGFVDPSLNKFCQTYWHADNAATSAVRMVYSHTTNVMFATTGLFSYSLVQSWNSDGFTLQNLDQWETAYPIYYLLIKGGEFKVGNDTEPGSTGNQVITTSTDVKAVGIFGNDGAVHNNIQSTGMWTSGFGDSSLNQSVLTQDEVPASDPMANAAIIDNDQIYINMTANATATSSTRDDEAALTAVSSTGFTLNWTNIGNARTFRYVTFGGQEEISYQSYGNMLQAFDSNKNAIYG
jgi:hypothetical protein